MCFCSGSQILLKIFCQSSFYDRSDDMDDLLCRKIISVRQHRNRCRLFIIRAVLCPELIHLTIALRPKLDAREGMDAVLHTCLTVTFLCVCLPLHHLMILNHTQFPYNTTVPSSGMQPAVSKKLIQSFLIQPFKNLCEQLRIVKKSSSSCLLEKL